MKHDRANARVGLTFGGALAGALLVTVLLTACRGAGGGARDPTDRVGAGPGNRPWHAGPPEIQEDIRKLLAQVPTTTGAGRVELGRRIVAYGEPAVPILVEALCDPDTDMRGTAAWLLGFFKDPRTANALARACRDCEALVRYEAATSLVRMVDRRGLDTLIRGLEDRDPRIRARCATVLQDATGETFGFQPDDAPVERAAAVARWRAWAARMGGMRR